MPRKYIKLLVKAEGITILDLADSKPPRKERYKGQVALGLTYGGVSLVDLFENSYRGSLEEEKMLILHMFFENFAHVIRSYDGIVDS